MTARPLPLIDVTPHEAAPHSPQTHRAQSQASHLSLSQTTDEMRSKLSFPTPNVHVRAGVSACEHVVCTVISGTTGAYGRWSGMGSIHIRYRRHRERCETGVGEAIEGGFGVDE